MMSTPETDLATLLEAIGWSRSELARRLDCSESLVRKWFDASIAIPPAVLRWLASVARALERLTPPDNWRANSGYIPEG